MISALLWVRKGVASEVPEKYELDDEEYDRINQLANIQLEEAKEELKKDQKTKTNDDIEIDPELAEYNLDQYDDEDDENSISLFGNVKGLAYYASNEEDPYITINDEDDDEKEDVRILPTDNILVAAKTEDDVSQLEIYVYEEEQDNLYIHHDILLPSFPLCLEWLDFRLGRKFGTEGSGNYIAVGTFDPEIEIWDLDTLDSMYPDAILGKKQKKKKISKMPNAEFHTDSVMSLSWNKNHRNLLASSSADTTVKLWDLQSLKCAYSFNHHKDKVQQVKWHPIESTILLTASFDKSVAAFDSRAPTSVSFWNIGDTDPECIRWDPFSPQYFYVSTESGLVLYFDVRNFNSGQAVPVFTLHAHDSAVSSLDISSSIQGCIVTGSTDKSVKIWDVKDMKPNLVTSRDLGVGKVFTTQFCPDSPFQLAVAGSEGKVFIWDLSGNAGIRNSFKGRCNIPFSNEITIKDDKPPVTLADDESEQEEEDDDDDEDDDTEDIEDDSGDNV